MKVGLYGGGTRVHGIGLYGGIVYGCKIPGLYTDARTNGKEHQYYCLGSRVFWTWPQSMENQMNKQAESEIKTGLR